MVWLKKGKAVMIVIAESKRLSMASNPRLSPILYSNSFPLLRHEHHVRLCWLYLASFFDETNFLG